jgi:uncharacterized repeat protein (TIGR01451 family)
MRARLLHDSAIVLTLPVLLLTVSWSPSLKTHAESHAVHPIPCPLQEQTGRTIVSFASKQILAHKDEPAAQSAPVAVNLPPGPFAITLVSYDNHSDHPQQVQTNERWFLHFFNTRGEIIATSPAISDLPEDQNFLTELVTSFLEVPESTTAVLAFHAAFPSRGANSISPVCAAIDPRGPSVCGNTIVEGEEQCDDGNTVSGDGCSEDCRREVCGNGTVDPGEECDDGNRVDGDGCSVQCRREGAAICGNGIMEENEACDDGNSIDGDGCSGSCMREECSNGSVDAGEECDDGNGVSGDGCSEDCRREVCGNGTVDPGEECDDGNIAQGDGCTMNCRFEVCGNSILDFGEECDDGNAVSGDGCSPGCRKEEQIIVSGNGGKKGGPPHEGSRRFPVALTIEKQVREGLTFIDGDTPEEAAWVEGHSAHFRLIVQNLSDYPVEDVLLEESFSLESGSTISPEISHVRGADFDPEIHSFQIPRIDAHTSAEVTFTLRAHRRLLGLYRNTSTIKAYGIVFASTGIMHFSKIGIGREDHAYLRGEDEWLEKTPNIREVLAGGTIVYTFTVRNLSRETLRDLKLQDAIDLSRVTVIDPAGGELTENVLTWQIAELPPSGVWMVRMTVQAKQALPHGDIIRNTAVLEGPAVEEVPLELRRRTVEVTVLRIPQTGAPRSEWFLLSPSWRGLTLSLITMVIGLLSLQSLLHGKVR